MNQKHVFGYRFLVTNRNVFEGHENTPQLKSSTLKLHDEPSDPLKGDSSISRMPGYGPNALPKIGYR